MPETKQRPSPEAWAGKRIRLSQDDPSRALAGPLSFYAAPDQENRWRNWDLDSRTLDRISPADLIELLADLSPDISRALWDFLRMCNPGHEVKVFRPGSETIDKPGQAAAEAFLETLQGLYGSVDVVINRLFVAAFVRGGFFAEIILDQAGRLPVDLATPDPRWLNWRKRQDPVRGQVFEMFQWQGGQAVSLEAPTVRYVPVDPLPGKPHGRSPAAPALFTVLFALGLLHDLRRVVSQQGYPRIDVEVDLQALKDIAPDNVKSSWEEFDSWVGQVVQGIYTIYGELEPDDAYVHASYIKVNRPVGTVDASSLGAIPGLFEILERWAIRALKSMPLLFGAPDGASEANANRQYEIHSAGIAALQHLCENLLEHLLGRGLQAQGQQGTVQFRFAALRASEELRDEQTRALKIKNSSDEYQAGWISQDQAAEKGAGVKKADQEKPRGPIGGMQGGTQNPAAVQPEPGVNRARQLETERFNPNHDPHSGEFTGSGATHVHQSREFGPIPMRPATEEERQSLKIPPGYTSPHVPVNAGSPLLWKATTPSGKDKQEPTPEHKASADATKFKRVEALHRALPAEREKWNAEIAFEGKNRQEALVLRLVAQTGIRNGGEEARTLVKDPKTGEKHPVPTYGASTLRSEHAKVDGDTIHFDFTGKGGIHQYQHSVTDAVLARHIEARQRDGHATLFDTSDKRVRDYLQKTSGEPFKVHDLRTRHATVTAAAVMERIDRRGETPKTAAELDTQIKRVVKVAARRIGDSEKVAQDSYINPEVFIRWQSGVE